MYYQDDFVELIKFSKIGEFQVVHASLLEAMKGHLMSENDIRGAVARVIQRKLEKRC